MKVIVLMLMSFFSLSPALAFTLNSSSNPNLIGWANADIQLLVNTANCPSGIDVPGIIAEAVEVWNNVPTSSIKVSYGGLTTSTSFSNPTTVYCETNFTTVVRADQNSVPGAAAVNGATGQITQGILYLNASTGTGNIANFDHTTLKIILAHEIGHILGLGHSHDTHSLMYYDGTAKKELSLSQDDMDGISYLYPSNEFKDNKIAGCGLVTNQGPPGGGIRMLIWILLTLPLALYAGLRGRAHAQALRSIS